MKIIAEASKKNIDNTRHSELREVLCPAFEANEDCRQKKIMESKRIIDGKITERLLGTITPCNEV